MIEEEPDTEEPDSAEKPGPVTSLNRALDALEAFGVGSSDAELSLGALYERTGLSKGTLRRLLRNLMDRGYIRQNPDTRLYRLGLRSWELGVVAIGGMRLERTLAPYLLELADITSEQVTVWLYEEGDVVCVQRAESSQQVRSSTRIGTRQPAYRLAAGQVLMAWCDTAELMAIFEHTWKWDRATIDEMLVKLGKVRDAGTARNPGGVSPELYAVAAPVRDYVGEVVCAISVSGPIGRFTEDTIQSISDELLKTAARVSAELGYLPASPS